MLNHNYIDRAINDIKTQFNNNSDEYIQRALNLIEAKELQNIERYLNEISYEEFYRRLLKNIQPDDDIKDLSHFNQTCNAPHSSLYFDMNGNVYPCCMNKNFSYGNITKTSLKKIVFGEKRIFLQNKLDNYNFSFGCTSCGNMIKSNNKESSYTTNFKQFKKENNYLKVFPQVFEFSLHNTCNLTCVTCGGDFSSSIRLKIEKRPKLKMVYTDKFLNELKEFIPHLKVCRFVGGEPFLIAYYKKIWDLIKKYNKNCIISITTNGTVLSKTVLDMLNYHNTHIICSIDALDKNVFESIRIGADFSKIMNNLNLFLSKKKLKALAVTPTVLNMFEIPRLLSFCAEKNIDIYFNHAYDYLSGYKPQEVRQKIFIHQLNPKAIEDYILFLDNNFKKANFNEYYNKKMQSFINRTKLFLN